MANVSTETSAKTSALSRVGTILTIASVVVLAIPLLYVLYGIINGNVQFNSSDSVHSLFTFGIVLTALAGVLRTSAGSSLLGSRPEPVPLS